MWRRTSSAINLAQGKAVMTSNCCEGFSRASWAARAAKSTPVTFSRSQVTTTMETATTTTATTTDPETAVKRLFDVDCNLTHETFAKIGVERAIRAARNEGVEAMLVPGSDVGSSREAQCLAAQDNLAGVRILYTAGVHPYEASKEPDAFISKSLRSVRELGHGAAAIGECGLDFSEGFPEADSQLAWFAPQVALACELKKPLFLHERLAHKAFLEVLDQFSSTLPPAIVHCFTGTASELQTYLDRGFYISVSGLICREQAGKDLREALAQVRPPLDRIMVETDAPYLGFPGCQASLVPSEATPKERKKILKAVSPNVPASLPLVVEALAKTLNMDVNRLAQATFDNANRFFS